MQDDIATLSFEDAMKQLEAIVGQLETGQATLDDSIALYERGAALRAHCDRRLKDAEERVERIVLAAGGGAATGVVPVEGL